MILINIATMILKLSTWFLPILAGSSALQAAFHIKATFLVVTFFGEILPPISCSKAVEHMSVETQQKKQYCSFFKNRAPNTQLGLKNCTWFKENSCCRQQEINAIFPSVKPLRGASPACQRYTNYLMCYVCAPNQGDFYMEEKLTVCEEFCDSWYDACQNAILKGSVIKDLYSNGSEYCHSRRFKVRPTKLGRCFFFDAKQDTSASGHLVGTVISTVFCTFLATLMRP